jgi:hypothetical protein
MPNLSFWRIFAALSFAAALSACGKAAAPAAPPPTAVTVVTLKTAPLTLTRELPGRTTPFLVAEVRPQVTGLVTARLFTEGGLVRAGDALYQLDDATYRADTASADAAVARANALLESAQLKARRADELIKIHAISTRIMTMPSPRCVRPKPMSVSPGGVAVGSGAARLQPHHGADCRPHRQIVGDRRCAGDRQPVGIARDHPAA